MGYVLPIFQRSAWVRTTGRFLDVINHIVMTIECCLERLDDGKTLADSDHLFQGRFDLTL